MFQIGFRLLQITPLIKHRPQVEVGREIVVVDFKRTPERSLGSLQVAGIVPGGASKRVNAWKLRIEPQRDVHVVASASELVEL